VISFFSVFVFIGVTRLDFSDQFSFGDEQVFCDAGLRTLRHQRQMT